MRENRETRAKHLMPPVAAHRITPWPQDVSAEICFFAVPVEARHRRGLKQLRQ